MSLFDPLFLIVFFQRTFVVVVNGIRNLSNRQVQSSHHSPELVKVFATVSSLALSFSYHRLFICTVSYSHIDAVLLAVYSP